MASKSNCLRFGVEELSKLLERAGRRDIIARLRVEVGVVRAVTADGREYSLG
jgi:hypothetical protein